MPSSILSTSHTHPHHPPPLDLGGPAIEGADPIRPAKRAALRGRGVEFSPVVQAYSTAGSDSASGVEADGEGEGDTEGDSRPVMPTDTGLISDQGKRKRKTSTLIAGLSPKLSLIQSRAQASIGVSPAGTQDAPSGNRSIRESRPPPQSVEY
jgi:hypothetical protein